jgi:xanthine dehydrogenase YagR molybdenum-binding subunit
LKAAYDQRAAGRQFGGNLHARLARLNCPYLEVSVTQLAPGQDPSALNVMRNGGLAVAGPAYPQATAMSYIAHL